MKRIFSLVAVMAFLVSFSASAQTYYVYDGDTFSVMLTSNSADTKIIKVQFSDNNQWHNFDIVDFEDLESSNKGGFLYTVLDGKGDKYTVDYYRYADYIIVTDVQDGESWKLFRRKG